MTSCLDGVHVLAGKLGIHLMSKVSSVHFSLSVVSDSLWPPGPQHARPPCPSPSPGVYWNSCPSSWWCHRTISSSVTPFSSWLQSFPASGSFQKSQLFTSGGRRIGVLASACLSNEYSRLISFRMDWLDLLAVQGTLKSLLQHHSLKASILWCSAWLRNEKSGFETQIQRWMMEHPPEFRETTTLPSRWSWVDFQTVVVRASWGQSHRKANMDGQCVLITAERLKHFPGASVVKNLPAVQEPLETWVWTLGQEDPPEEEMETLFTVLAWKIL